MAESLEQLGSLYMEIGEDDEAAVCLNGALNIFKVRHGEGLKVAEVYETLANKFERKDQHEKTLMYLNKALKVRSKVNSQDDVNLANLHYRIGRLCRDSGKDHEALSSFQSGTFSR